MNTDPSFINRTVNRIADQVRPHFSGNGCLARLHPFYDAIETVLLWPDRTTAAAPHIRDGIDLKRFMSLVIVSLLPPLLFGLYNTGLQSRLTGGLSPDPLACLLTGIHIFLPMLLVSYAAGLFWETLFASVRGHAISEGFLVSGLLFPLTLPPTMPLWQVAVGISFGVVIGKEVFGGTGRNLLNPALTARAFVFFAYPSRMSGDVWIKIPAAGAVDACSGATPLGITAAASDGAAEALRQAGWSFQTLFVGNYPGAIGATSALACLLGGLFLILVGVASWRTMAGGMIGVLTTAGLIRIMALIIDGPEASAFCFLNPALHLVMGGFAFGIVYMATDPVSSPGVEGMRWVYGFLIGALTVLIRVYNPAYPEGVMLAILLMNVFAPLLDHIALVQRMRRRIPNV
ncbi:MAG: NADH:ubiquinone reductase (Na(+)-transporting) subunit B [Desulfobacterales bacterium]|nr:MAG: NADH:ubiquinone reductase (Na(+)-transporting) subunit B [Desulfobacterales bacterium]